MLTVEALRKYVDKRVALSGVMKIVTIPPGKNERSALVEECFVTTDDGHTVDVDHTWLRGADNLIGQDIGIGDRFSASVRVHVYCHKTGEMRYGFNSPTSVVKANVALTIPSAKRHATPVQTPIVPPSEPVPMQSVQAVAVAEPTQPSVVVPPTPTPTPPVADDDDDVFLVSELCEVTALARKLGGVPRLKKLIAALEV
jgi:hypothetical protein